MTVRVHRAQWCEIKPYAALAAKERVNVTETQAGTVWFKTVDARGRLTGFAGVAPMLKHKARIRAVWVRPDFRGDGLGNALSAACLNQGLEDGFTEIEILSWDKRWALRSGFVDQGETQHGATRLLFTADQTETADA